MRKINRLVIHGSWTPEEMDIGAAEIRRWHTVDNGWRDIGYHGVIRRDGMYEDGRPEKYKGAHAGRYNSGSMGVCLIGGKLGDGWENNYTEEQFMTLKGVVNWWAAVYSIPMDRVVGHCDLPGVSKLCPGFSVKKWIAAGMPTNHTGQS